jgi:hypothetical protein
MSNVEIDWTDEHDHLVVQREALPVMVYDNPHGDLVIREQRAWDEERDSVIIISRANVPGFLAKIAEMVGLDEAKLPVLMLPKPEPLSPADRQRRYRNKHRNGNGDGRRHDGNGHDVTPSALAPTAHQQELAS